MTDPTNLELIITLMGSFKNIPILEGFTNLLILNKAPKYPLSRSSSE